MPILQKTAEIVHGNSTPDQIQAIDHIGSHARLLAGPGTGKTNTLTRRVLSLVLIHDVEPESILVLTFTRLAALQLREQIEKKLADHAKTLPDISTLHSFALKQIVRNSHNIHTLQIPIRIADDWEERHIVQEDLKKELRLRDVREVQRLIQRLSADWETLRVEEAGWEFPNAAFLGALRAHQRQYGETLRAELVYQLKLQLSQNRNFQLEKKYTHILVDEYQDLNSCDLAIVNELVGQGGELFVAGDDDQSIYGFRFAEPTGIKNFDQVYANSKKLALEICFRCDRKILRAAEFVAALDERRLPKPTRPRDDAQPGVVLIVGCKDQQREAEAVAEKIENLIKAGTQPDEITILLRNDPSGALSRPVLEELKRRKIALSKTDDSELENNVGYRSVLSLLRLLVDGHDNLAWRTLLEVGKNGLGEKCISSISQMARVKGEKFSLILERIVEEPRVLPVFGRKILRFFELTKADLDRLHSIEDPREKVVAATDGQVTDAETRENIKKYLIDTLLHGKEKTIEELVKIVNTASVQIEQETKKDAVNVLTMHQAKGLTFDVCFILGAEDEIIPGKNLAEKEGDERRLLYVSMTRARHKLYISYCGRRTGRQAYLGRNSGSKVRSLTRFLRESKIPIKQL